MTQHCVVIQNRVMAENIDSLNRSFYSGSDLDNGWIFSSASQLSTQSGSSELWYAVQPTTGSLNGLWMASTPEVPITYDGDYAYRGLNQDPRNFYNKAGKIIDAFKPQPGDIITASSGIFDNAIASNGYANSLADNWRLHAGATPLGTSVMSWRVLATTYISIGSGGIDNQRVTAYKLECLYN
jgi:hypothetical protein